jgi:type IV pilus assembly protein PilQ
LALTLAVTVGAAHAQEPSAPEQPASTASDSDEPPANDNNGTLVEVDDHGTVMLRADELPLSTALRMLSIKGRRNIVATPGVKGFVTANLYHVPFEDALDAILLANNAGYRTEGNFIYVYTNEELAEIIQAETPFQTRVFRLNHIAALDAQAMITPLLSEGGSCTVSPPATMGIAPSAEEAGGNQLASRDMLVVHDRPDRIMHVTEVLRQIDVRPRQVLIEATILRAQITEDNALGVDFTITGGVDFEALAATSAGVGDLSLGTLSGDALQGCNSLVSTDFTGAVPPGGLTVGVIKDHVAFFVRALEGIADTTVLANPKILALNKQRGEVIVGRQDGYPVIVTTETTTQQTSALLETGTRLIFRPFIGDDGFVRMELHPEDSRGEVVGDQPQKETTEVTTNVMIKDGQTILIGGLFRESTRDARGQVPLLGNIPILGTAFRSRRDTTDREEVIILLTVHIVKDDVFAEAGKEELQKIERIRVGARHGIQWFGRERLAQAHYRAALEHFAAGDDGKALWDVQLALHNSPRFYDAILLKEKLLNERDWDDEGAVTRSFIHQLIADERDGYEYPYGRPAPPFTRPEPDELPNEFDDALGDPPVEPFPVTVEPGADDPATAEPPKADRESGKGIEVVPWEEIEPEPPSTPGSEPGANDEPDAAEAS